MQQPTGIWGVNCLHEQHDDIDDASKNETTPSFTPKGFAVAMFRIGRDSSQLGNGAITVDNDLTKFHGSFRFPTFSQHFPNIFPTFSQLHAKHDMFISLSHCGGLLPSPLARTKSRCEMPMGRILVDPLLSLESREFGHSFSKFHSVLWNIQSNFIDFITNYFIGRI